MIIEIMERYYKHYYSSNETTNRTNQTHYYLNIARHNSYKWICIWRKTELNVLK